MRPTQKVRALLAYLALEADKPQPRGRLRGLLWPDSDDAAALGNLRKELHRLQQALAQRDPSLSAGLLSVNRQTIQLDKNFFSTDVAEFEALLRECEAHPHLDVHTCPTSLEALDRAAALYQGELLAGLALEDAPEFEEWLLLRRSSLHNQALAALETLADAHEKRGDDARALLYVTRQLSLDPYLEAAQRQRMRLLARSGQASEALRSYEAWRRLLAAEMGVEPAAQTTGLYERIQAGDIATLRQVRHNLPLSLTALLGRHEELARMAGLLASASCRLLTLYGAVGVGKTSLALAAAREALEGFPDGVFFVSLAAIDNPELVLAMIAQALEVRAVSAQPLLEALKTGLGDKKMLLVLDNFEQLLEAAPVVKELLASCPELKVIVTSRALLELRGEVELEVPPLAVPDVRHIPCPEALLGYPAVALFCERARAVKPDFRLSEENAATVATICVRLDGLPLAIELVAARVKLMSLGKLLERLVGASGRFALLTGGARDLPLHQRTLQSTMAWSYELLEPEQKALFARLAVFSGSFSLEAADEVCSLPTSPGLDILEGVTRLVNKSLLRHEESSGEVRFSMLETLREYGLERLRESGEEIALRHRHAAYYEAFVVRAAPELVRAEQALWLDRLEHEHHNLRAALEWYLEIGQAERVISINWALWRYWWVRGQPSEGQRWLERALALGENLAEETRAQGLATLAFTLFLRGDLKRASELFEESLELSASMALELKVFAHVLYGNVALGRGDDSLARHPLSEALALSRAAQQDDWSGAALGGMALVELRAGNFPAAAARLEEAEVMLRACEDFIYLMQNLNIQGLMRLLERDYALAEGALRESLALAHRLKNTFALMHALLGLAMGAVASHQGEKAARLFGAAEALRESRGIRHLQAEGIRLLYDYHVAALRGQLDEATFAREWALGRRLLLDEAVALALGPTTPFPAHPNAEFEAHRR